MDWLHGAAFFVGGLEVLLAGVNCRYFGRYALRSRLQSRRIAAWTLCLVSGAMALESAFYVLRGAGFAAGPTLRALTELLVRLGLFLGAGAVSLLVWRGRRRLR